MKTKKTVESQRFIKGKRPGSNQRPLEPQAESPNLKSANLQYFKIFKSPENHQKWSISVLQKGTPI